MDRGNGLSAKETGDASPASTAGRRRIAPRFELPDHVGFLGITLRSGQIVQIGDVAVRAELRMGEGGRIRLVIAADQAIPIHRVELLPPDERAAVERLFEGHV